VLDRDGLADGSHGLVARPRSRRPDSGWPIKGAVPVSKTQLARREEGSRVPMRCYSSSAVVEQSCVFMLIKFVKVSS